MSIDTMSSATIPSQHKSLPPQKFRAIKLILEDQLVHLRRELNDAGNDFATSVRDRVAGEDLADTGAHHSELWYEVCVAESVRGPDRRGTTRRLRSCDGMRAVQESR